MLFKFVILWAHNVI